MTPFIIYSNEWTISLGNKWTIISMCSIFSLVLGKSVEMVKDVTTAPNLPIVTATTESADCDKLSLSEW
uniref:Uncharacterized protein n=1 Tax=Ditylenchus dipsaci TaxID=166011 RepID=A0A915ECB9_9BILA